MPIECDGVAINGQRMKWVGLVSIAWPSMSYVSMILRSFALNLKPDNPLAFLRLAKLHFILGELEDGLR
jgi:hypothetical protein